MGWVHARAGFFAPFSLEQDKLSSLFLTTQVVSPLGYCCWITWMILGPITFVGPFDTSCGCWALAQILIWSTFFEF